MAYQDINIGTSPGDHTGDTARTVFTKLKAMLVELYALVGSSGTGYLSVVLASGTTNNLDPGSSFPTSISWLDFDTTAGAATLTGLLAGTDGQTVTLRVTGANALTLSTGGTGLGDSGSTAANRFTGEGDSGMLLGSINRITYRALPSPTWAIG